MKTFKIEVDGHFIPLEEFPLKEVEDYLEKSGSGTYYLTIENVSVLHDEKDYRRVYFMFRDILWENDNRGYSKKEFHNMLKVACMLDLTGDAENYNCAPALSTKCLTLIGWKRYLEIVKEFAKNEFGIYL